MQNGIIGDITGVELPQMEVDEKELTEEKKMARYSKSAEYKRIEQWCRERIAFYQTHFPDGRLVGVDKLPTPEEWAAANIIILELSTLLNGYEVASEVVENKSVR